MWVDCARLWEGVRRALCTAITGRKDTPPDAEPDRGEGALNGPERRGVVAVKLAITWFLAPTVTMVTMVTLLLMFGISH